MSSRKPSRKVLRSLCAEVSPEDGIDPRTAGRRDRASNASGRKARQLGRQVAEALHQVLADSADETLRSLRVVAVEPAPNAARLAVTLAALSRDGFDPAHVLEHLERAGGRLRAEVAAAITRKRAPLLVYRLASPPGGSP